MPDNAEGTRMDMIGNLLLIVFILVLAYVAGCCSLWFWRRSPTLREYLAKYEACKGEGEVGCYRCGTFYPLTEETLYAVRSKTQCSCCKAVLWRSEV